MDLARRTASDKVICDKAINIANNSACDEEQWFTDWFTKKLIENEADMHADNTDIATSAVNQPLTGEFQNLAISKFQKCKLY